MLQEILLARNIIIQVGQQSVEWHELSSRNPTLHVSESQKKVHRIY
jgi:hypothetical protein